ncbi:MAG: response regulator [Polyangiaceae bacterium]
MIEDILVIDDDPVVTRMLSRVLSSHRVVVAHSGEDALTRIATQSFALILCDLSMPGMSGMDFYDSVKTISADIARRVVFMTGGAFTAESHDFLVRHENSWLEKPFDIVALRKLIARASEL